MIINLNILLDTINRLFNCGSDFETNSHFFLYSSNFLEERTTLVGTVSEINSVFFIWILFSRTFTKHRTAGEEEGHYFNSTLILRPVS